MKARYLSVILCSIILSACGGSSKQSETSRSISGRVIDDPIKDAYVFLDLNQNGSKDSNEPQSKNPTDENGFYSIDISGINLPAKYDVVSMGGKLKGEEFKAWLKTTCTNTNTKEDIQNINLTPLSSLTSSLMKKGFNQNEAQNKINQYFTDANKSENFKNLHQSVVALVGETSSTYSDVFEAKQVEKELENIQKNYTELHGNTQKIENAKNEIKVIQKQIDTQNAKTKAKQEEIIQIQQQIQNAKNEKLEDKIIDQEELKKQQEIKNQQIKEQEQKLKQLEIEEQKAKQEALKLKKEQEEALKQQQEFEKAQKAKQEELKKEQLRQERLKEEKRKEQENKKEQITQTQTPQESENPIYKEHNDKMRADLKQKTYWIEFPHEDVDFDREYLQKYFYNPDVERGQIEQIFFGNDESITLELKQNGRSLEHVEWFYSANSPWEHFVNSDKPISEQEKIDANIILKPLGNGKVQLSANKVMFERWKNNQLFIDHKNDLKMDRKGSIVGTYIIGGKRYYNRIPYSVLTPKESERVRKNQKVYEKVDDIIREAHHLSDFNKAKFIYDYLAKNVIYDLKYSGRPSLENTLIRERAVCQGYAVAYSYMANKLGLKVKTIIGNAFPGTTIEQLHAWNALQLDDEWYYIDSTWASSSDPNHPVKDVNYNYFLMNKNEVKKDHQLNENTLGDLKMGEKYLFKVFEDNNMYADNSENLKKLIVNLADRVVVDKPDNHGKLAFNAYFLTAKQFHSKDIEPLLVENIKTLNNISISDGEIKDFNGRSLFNFEISLKHTYHPSALHADLEVKDYADQSRTTKTLILKIYNLDSRKDELVLKDIQKHNISIKGAQIENLRKISDNNYEIDLKEVSSENLLLQIKKYPFYTKDKEVNVRFVSSAAQTPNVKITGVDEEVVRVTNVGSNEYYNNARLGQWIELRENMNIRVDLTRNLLVQKRNVPYKSNSNVQFLNVHDQPKTFLFGLEAKSNKQVKNLNTNFEYIKKHNFHKTTFDEKTEQVASMSSWTSVKDPYMTFESGEYCFRLKGKKNILSSEKECITIP